MTLPPPSATAIAAMENALGGYGRPASTSVLVADSHTSTLTPAPRRALALAEAKPGITIRELSRALGCSHATATYHLALLVRLGLLTRQRDGRDVRHYAARSNARGLFLAAVCRDPRARAIVEFLTVMPRGLTVNRMAVHLGVPFGFLRRTLLRLETQGFVKNERSGIRFNVKVAPDFAALVRFAISSAEEVASQVRLSPATEPAPDETPN